MALSLTITSSENTMSTQPDTPTATNAPPPPLSDLPTLPTLPPAPTPAPRASWAEQQQVADAVRQQVIEDILANQQQVTP